MLKVVIKTESTKPVIFTTIEPGIKALNLAKHLTALGWIVSLIAF